MAVGVYCFNWTQSSRSLSGSFTLRRKAPPSVAADVVTPRPRPAPNLPTVTLQASKETYLLSQKLEFHGSSFLVASSWHLTSARVTRARGCHEEIGRVRRECYEDPRKDVRNKSCVSVWWTLKNDTTHEQTGSMRSCFLLKGPMARYNTVQSYAA